MTIESYMRKFEDFKAAYGQPPNAVLVGPDDEDDIPNLGLRVVFVDGLRGIAFAIIQT